MRSLRGLSVVLLVGFYLLTTAGCCQNPHKLIREGMTEQQVVDALGTPESESFPPERFTKPYGPVKVLSYKRCFTDYEIWLDRKTDKVVAVMVVTY